MKKFLPTSLTVLLSLFALSGCVASNGNDAEGANRIVNEKGETTHFCRNEQIAGSHFKQRVCRTPAQIEEERQRSQDDMENARRGPLNTGNM